MSHWEANGKSDDWYTPKYVFDALGCVFDLDVAAPLKGPRHVPTLYWFSHHALTRAWHGFVWMNPPFGGRNAIEPWLKKFFEHGNGIALTPDRTSAPWFQYWAQRADAILFTPKIRFERPDGTLGVAPSNGTALLSIGKQGTRALARARDRKLGIYVVPM